MVVVVEDATGGGSAPAPSAGAAAGSASLSVVASVAVTGSLGAVTGPVLARLILRKAKIANTDKIMVAACEEGNTGEC